MPHHPIRPIRIHSAARAICTAGVLAATAHACRSAVPNGHPPEAVATSSSARSVAPALLAQQLLDADRASSRSAQGRPFPAAFTPMFADDVRMPLRDSILVGPAALLSSLGATADSGGTVSWTPVRVGISADGRHGFTAGVQFITRRDGSRHTARYLAYWVRDDDQRWRVAAWRRRPLGIIVPDTSRLPAVLPGDMSRIDTDRSPSGNPYATLVAAEQGFSDEASRVGLGRAFAMLGDDQAINMGRPDDVAFVRGPTAIAALVAGGQALEAPSAIVWNADTALVATSGDLGVTFGIIRPKQALPNGPKGAAFFTIWRRASRTAPWRYVAE